MHRETVRRLFRLAFWIAAAVAYVAAVWPETPAHPGGPEIVAYDKGNHLIAFATLAFLARVGWSRGRALLIALGLVAFGGAIELSQALPQVHRDASWADFGTDIVAVALGIAAGALLLALLRRRFPVR